MDNNPVDIHVNEWWFNDSIQTFIGVGYDQVTRFVEVQPEGSATDVLKIPFTTLRQFLSRVCKCLFNMLTLTNAKVNEINFTS